MRVYLYRHGQTAGNAKGQYIGRTDEPLSKEGLADVQACTVRPGIGKVYVSPLLRARETARLLFPNAAQCVRDGLREMDFGAFEQKNYRDLENDAAYRAWVESGCTLPCPGGEDMAAFGARVCACFEDIVREAEENGEDEVHIVAHGGTIMAVFSGFVKDGARDYYAWGVKNLAGRSAEAVRTDTGALRLCDTEEIRL